MAFFLTSDTHFNHDLIVELRGFKSREEHDEAIINAWNSRITKADVVFHLGDFMLPYRPDVADTILRRLNGEKILIFGNHDPKRLADHKQWRWSGHIRARKVDGTPIVMSHYALRSWPGMGKGALHVYGHSHSNLAPDYGKSMDVGVDTRADWTPWSLDEIRVLLHAVPVLVVDHHDETEGDPGEGITDDVLQVE